MKRSRRSTSFISQSDSLLSRADNVLATEALRYLSIKGLKTFRKSAKNQGAPVSVNTDPGARLPQTPMMNMSLDLGIGDTVTNLLALFKVLNMQNL